MEFIIGGIIAVGIIYCLVYVLPLTVREITELMKEEEHYEMD